ncbi:MAG: TIM barrel protein [Planctomycetota bacterium]
MKSCMFSKHLQEYSVTDMGKALKNIGFDAVDLTVCKGGHVEPAEAAQKLPEAVAALKKVGVSVAMITTNIILADDPLTRPILETAKKLGIRYYKIGYYHYDGFGRLKAQLAEIKAKLRDIAALSKEIGICGGYHNHSGRFIGACMSHVAHLLDGLDPKAICAYFDIGHATIEGIALGWLQGFDEVADRVKMLAFKDLAVDYSNDEDRITTVPMGTGPVFWKRFAESLKKVEKQIGLVSYHGEYEGKSAKEVLELTKKDRQFFEKIWGGSF